MCGRFTLFEPDKVLSREFGVSGFEPKPPRYNISPSQPVAVVRAAGAGGGRELAYLRWGLIPSWAKEPGIGDRLINARAETVRAKPSFRGPFRRRRCLIPASGFYEWRKLERGKQPYYVRMRDGSVFAFAGLWDLWENPEGGKVESCTILTTEANSVVAPIHDRMPVILPRESHARWIGAPPQDADSLLPLLVPFDPEGMTAFPVGTRVNNPEVDDAGCMAAVS